MTPTTPSGWYSSGRGLVGGQQAGRDRRGPSTFRACARGPRDVVDGEGDLEDGVGVRLAVLAVDELGELVHPPRRAPPSRPAGGARRPSQPCAAPPEPRPRGPAPPPAATSAAPCTDRCRAPRPLAGSSESKVSTAAAPAACSCERHGYSRRFGHPPRRDGCDSTAGGDVDQTESGSTYDRSSAPARRDASSPRG